MAKGAHEIPRKKKTVRGAHEIPGKKLFFPRWLVLLLLLLTISVGGVVAFLSTSANSLNNGFDFEDYPSITVRDGSITVNHEGYAVFLRATVVVNWVKDGKILAEDPELDTDYTLSVNDSRWFNYDSDGFFYYDDVIMGAGSDAAVDIAFPVTVQATAENHHPDYQLKATVLAQVVQTLGETDGSTDPLVAPVPAVVDAWGVDLDNAVFAKWKTFLNPST